MQAFLVELLITFVLAFVVLSVATDERVPAGVVPSAIGFALAPRARSSPAPRAAGRSTQRELWDPRS